MNTPTSFPFFPLLPLELRQKIWALTVTSPRLIHIVKRQEWDHLAEYGPRWALHDTDTGPFGRGPNPYSRSGLRYVKDQESWISNPCSYGGTQPAALSVNHESRTEALRYLTWMFDCYWNLEADFLYIEVPHRRVFATGWARPMLTAGVLDRIKNIAFDRGVWGTNIHENCITALRSLPSIESCAFVFRNASSELVDVLDPGVAWKLVPVTHGNDERDRAEEKVKEFLTLDKQRNAEEWSRRLSDPEFTWNEISDRKLADLPRIHNVWHSPEPPGQDWFG